MTDVEQGPDAQRLGALFDNLPGWAPNAETAKGRALAEGLVVIDANVLLHLYRYGESARYELISALQLLGDRLFIPHQVAKEFAINRISTALDTRQQIREAASKAEKTLEGLAAELNRLGDRMGLSSVDRGRLSETTVTAATTVSEILGGAVESRGWIDGIATNDPVLPVVEDLLRGKVGRPYSPAVEASHRSDAERRYAAKTPPGYADASTKEDPSGDFLVWRQLLDEASHRKVAAVLITDDAKEDWLFRVKGKTIGPQPALVAEALHEAGVEFHIVSATGFLRLAPTAIRASVSQSTLQEAEAQSAEQRRRVAARRRRMNELGKTVAAGAAVALAGLAAGQESYQQSIAAATESARTNYAETLRESLTRLNVPDVEGEVARRLAIHDGRRPTASQGVAEGQQVGTEMTHDDRID